MLGRTMKWSADFEDRLRSLTAADVSAAFRRHVRPDQLVVVKAGSFGERAAVVAGPGERRLPACTAH
jgi:zinc protease